MSAAPTLQANALTAPARGLEADERYEAMRAEVAKLDVTSGDVDWRAVEGTSRRVLCELGQDLRAAAYWAHAGHVLGGSAGLEAGLALVTALLRDAWQALSPPLSRLKARTGALQWLVTRSEAYLEAHPEPLSAAAERRLRNLVEELAAIARQRLGERAPAFAGLRRLVAQRAAFPTGDRPFAPSEEASSAKTAPSTKALEGTSLPAQGATADVPPAFHATVETSLCALGRTLCSLAAARRAANAADPEAFRLLRTGLWLHLAETPPRVDGRTRIAPLPASARASLRHLAAHRAWAEMLERAEGLALEHRLCLDLQRCAAEALAGLGPSYRACLQAVTDQVRSLVQRLPDVVDLLARDGQPLADAATLRWLTQLGTETRPSSPQVAREGPALSDAEPIGSACARSRFLGRLRDAEARLAGGERQLAALLFEALYASMRRRRLFAWEPELGARVLHGYLQCRTAHQAGAPASVRALRRLATLDPKSAARLAENIS